MSVSFGPFVDYETKKNIKLVPGSDIQAFYTPQTREKNSTARNGRDTYSDWKDGEETLYGEGRIDDIKGNTVNVKLENKEQTLNSTGPSATELTKVKQNEVRIKQEIPSTDPRPLPQPTVISLQNLDNLVLSSQDVDPANLRREALFNEASSDPQSQPASSNNTGFDASQSETESAVDEFEDPENFEENEDSVTNEVPGTVPVPRPVPAPSAVPAPHTPSTASQTYNSAVSAASGGSQKIIPPSGGVNAARKAVTAVLDGVSNAVGGAANTVLRVAGYTAAAALDAAARDAAARAAADARAAAARAAAERAEEERRRRADTNTNLPNEPEPLPSLVTLDLFLGNTTGDSILVEHLADIVYKKSSMAALAEGHNKSIKALSRLVEDARRGGEDRISLEDVRAAARL
jgi:hypothetical protein